MLKQGIRTGLLQVCRGVMAGVLVFEIGSFLAVLGLIGYKVMF
ncbi:MAG: hypothetical protein M0Z55_06650 [Peptococcaceae bacterium]|nr:hypothetical protein [Peptococcaceae bacterium]